MTGCTEKDVDYSIDGARREKQTKADSGKSGPAQLADESEWEDMWETNTGVSVKVKADIVVPETEQMSVVEVEAPECNAEFKEQIAKNLFGDETVYYHDMDHRTKQELQEIYDLYKEDYDATPDEARREALKTQCMDPIEAAMENAGNDYTPADGYEEDEYIGKYNGIEYVLSCFGDDSSSNDRFYSTQINLRAYDISAVCPQEYEGYTQYMEYPDTDIVENECKLSEAEAEKQAVDFIEKLGMEYPVLSDTRPLIWGDDSMSDYHDYSVNGYVFHFAYGLDEVSFSGFGSDTAYDNSRVYGLPESDEAQYLTSAIVWIYVTEQGIIEMTANNPVKTAGITESVEILPLDEIKNIMKNQITENYEDFHFDASTGKELEFTDMELIYFRVTDNENEGHYSYIPAWRLSKQTSDKNGRNIKNPVVINAIDGSVIKLQAR